MPVTLQEVELINRALIHPRSQLGGVALFNADGDYVGVRSPIESEFYRGPDQLPGEDGETYKYLVWQERWIERGVISVALCFLLFLLFYLPLFMLAIAAYEEGYAKLTGKRAPDNIWFAWLAFGTLLGHIPLSLWLGQQYWAAAAFTFTWLWSFVA